MKPVFILITMLFIVTAILKAGEAVKIMPVGNSITAGEHYGFPALEERTGYRKDLYEMLIDSGYNVDFVGSKDHGVRAESDTNWYDWNNEAYPGWGIVAIAGKTIEALDVYEPDILLVHVGTNGSDWDQKPGQVMAMLNSINKYSVDNDHPMTVFLCKIVKRFIEEDSAPTSQFNIDFADSVAARTGDKIKIIIVDMENGAGLDYSDAPPDPTAEPPYEGGDYWGYTYPGMTSADKYHPNDKGNTKMAVKFYEELVKELDAPETMENNMVEGVELTATSDSTIKITWAANFLDEDGYNIERADSGSGFSIVGTANANTRYFLDSSVDATKECKYRIKAFNNTGGESLYSSEVSYIPAYYTLTTSVEGQGDVSVSPSKDSYLAGVGTIVTLTATPAQGWKFTKWSGDITAIYSNPTTVVMNSDISATANFKQLTDVDEDVSYSPKEFVLHQNYPNPFNPSTNIRFDLPAKSFVTVKVFNLIGQEVATLFEGFKQAGSHNVTFDASHLNTGAYFYRVKTDEWVGVKSMLLMK